MAAGGCPCLVPATVHGRKRFPTPGLLSSGLIVQIGTRLAYGTAPPAPDDTWLITISRATPQSTVLDGTSNGS
jgi:hypothetical protein